MYQIAVPARLTDATENKEARIEETQAWLTDHSKVYMKDMEQTTAVLEQIRQPGSEMLVDVVKAVDDAERVRCTTGVTLTQNPQLVDTVEYLRNLARLMLSDMGMLNMTLAPLREDFLRRRCECFKSDMESKYVKSACVRLLYFMRLLWPEEELDGCLLSKDSDEIYALALEKLDKIKVMTPAVHNLDADGTRLSTRIDVAQHDTSASNTTQREDVKRKIEHIAVDEDDVFGPARLVQPLLPLSRASKKMKVLMSSIFGDVDAGKMHDVALINPRTVMGEMKGLVSNVTKCEEDVFEDLESCVCIIKDIEDFVSKSMRTEIFKTNTYSKMLYVHQVIHELHKQVAVSNFMFSISVQYKKLMFKDRKKDFLISEADVESMLECPQSYYYMNTFFKKNMPGEQDIMQAFHIDK